MNEYEQTHESLPDQRPLSDETIESSQEAEPRAGPSIYVASLSDYNAGILHGRWIDAATDVDHMQEEIGVMLRSSPTMVRYGEPAEEWAIHDHDGFGVLRISEYDSLERIAILADGINKHGMAFAAWVDHSGETTEDSVTEFEDRYQGQWESAQAYAEHMLEELGAEEVLAKAADWLQPYLTLDVDGFARDMEIGGDVITAEADDGGVWVWSGW